MQAKVWNKKACWWTGLSRPQIRDSSLEERAGKPWRSQIVTGLA